ncbi:hypothetical protein BS47DRAFT_523272 [Hydnum rufescens UP504]|uniref:Uncharacterized protein n=1 Tax=Hydnum rufescens UP504 TaxID=1448309 RepID=A0A9P6B452_9AGAM|nr:hypothetical protein BS47DRAFT_523272 [Hydnum rufescens UP504]
MRLIAPRFINVTAIQVLQVLEHQLGAVDSVDALLLVGGFSANEYLFNRIRDRFRGRSAKLGLAQSLMHRPSWAPTIVASKSYIIGVGPNIADPAAVARVARSTATTRIPHQVYEAQYVVVKGAILKKGVAVLEEFDKLSMHSSDSEFVVPLYMSDSAEIKHNTNQGGLTHIRDWKIDLSVVRSFMRYSRHPPPGGFHTKFQVGIEIDSRDVWAVWIHDGVEGGRTKLHSIIS